MNTYIQTLRNSGFVEHVQDIKKQGIEILLEENNDSAHGHASKRNRVSTFKETHGISCYVNCTYSPEFFIIKTI